MAAPRTLELLSFKRTFTLIILLVVLPSAGLSGFGVLAIINERAAVEKRVEAVWSARLRAVQADLMRTLDSARVEALEPALRLSAGDLVLTEGGFRINERGVEADARLTALLEPVRREMASLPERPVFFSVSDGRGAVLVALVRRGDTVHGALVRRSALDAVLRIAGERATPSTEPAHFVVAPVKREAPEGMVARLVSGVTEARDSALGLPELATLSLPEPLQDFRLVAQAEGEDPVVAASSRNRTLYGVLLGVFYITLALGVVYTGRTLYREARLSRLKTDFVSLVSHELRTPLTSIRMFIEMLALGRVQDPKEMQTVLDMLSSETARLSSMIENVLDWARIEQGRKEYRVEVRPVTEVVDAAVAAFRAQRMGAPMDFEVQVAAGLPPVEVDRDAMAGALLNLLQNAFKYSGEGKRIRLRAVDDGGEVALEVEDNGPGIARREHRRIFDRFYRVDDLLTRTTEGTGLGLAIAQRTVQAHHGRISVDSTVGKGSTFRIHLPAAKA